MCENLFSFVANQIRLKFWTEKLEDLSLDVATSGFPTRSDTNRAVHPQKIARGLKLLIWEEEGLYYLGSENKGADQLRAHREADLRLCFGICKKPFFSQRGSFYDI